MSAPKTKAPKPVLRPLHLVFRTWNGTRVELKVPNATAKDLTLVRDMLARAEAEYAAKAGGAS